MKLIIKNNCIAAIVTDEYTGADEWMPIPDDFDPNRINEYRRIDDQLVITPPQTVTPRQAKIALLQAGLLDEIETVIASIPDETTRRIAQVEWEYAQEFRRDWQLLNQLAEQAGISQDQIDELFIAAAQI